MNPVPDDSALSQMKDASLDARTAKVVLEALLTICRQEHKTLLMVSHDETAAGAADQLLAMTEINRPVGMEPV